jgi:hypothetical protein
MPMHALHPPPPVQARVVLSAAREAGLEFDEAWTRLVLGTRTARARVIYPHATVERRFWKATLESQREEWRRCYERRPSRLSAAIVELVDLLAEDRSRPARSVVFKEVGWNVPAVALVPFPLSAELRAVAA